jgi:hypothetical protein
MAGPLTLQQQERKEQSLPSKFCQSISFGCDVRKDSCVFPASDQMNVVFIKPFYVNQISDFGSAPYRRPGK